MGIVDKIFGSTAVTVASITADITKAEAELAALNAQLDTVFVGLATMSDEDHVRAETRGASLKRAVARLEAKIISFHADLPAVQQAEEAAAEAAADAALRKRAESARKAVNVTAVKLLDKIDDLAKAMGDVLAELVEIDAEATAVNRETKYNPDFEHIPSVDQVHRKHPDRPASEKRETRPVWVYKNPISGKEEVRPATIDSNGNPRRVLPDIYDGQYVIPTLEQREVVVSRREHRPGAHLLSLTSIVLPPARVGGKQHWPRES